MKSKLLILIIVVLTECVPHYKTSTIGYCSIDPYAKEQLKKINKELCIYLSPSVKDSVKLEHYALNMIVKDFRRTVGDGLTKVFYNNFHKVRIVNSIENDNLTLVVYRVRPFWAVGGTNKESQISAAFEYETSLILKGEKLGSSDGKSYSDKKIQNYYVRQEVFEDGLRVMIENIEKGTLTDVTVKKLLD